ncbi:PAS domain S-box protein [Flavobacterium ovatum]|uniref:PAS domain S-box protein n=1 Tax=Flavobacterium ovatum TaxID=1928857 RepID=UPI003451036A
MDIEDKTNDELRTKLNKLLQEKNSLWGQIEKLAAGLVIANEKLSIQNKEKEKRAAELIIANKELLFQNGEKEKRAAELVIANKELAFQNEEKEKRAAELIIANKELLFQNEEKENRAAELVVANKELDFQHKQKEKRAAELIVANKELAFQNKQKENRAAELIIANKELAFQNEEKEKRAAELIVANKELLFQNVEKEKRAAELIVANKELLFQNGEKEKRAAELVVANKELAYQNKQKEKRAAELVVANKELAFQNKQKENRAAELVVANKELAFQNKQKENRAAELVVANKELAFQNKQKENRAAELVVANKELAYQNKQKEKRAAELIIANNELQFQSEEKVKRAAELIVSKEKAELYLDMAGSAFVSLDQKGNILLVNQKCLEILEYDRSEDLKGKNWFETCIPSEINKEEKQDYSKIMKGKMELVEYYENEVITKSGKRRLVYWNNSLIKDEEGQIKELLSSGIDITKRKQSEEALIKIKDEFHLLAESMPQIVWITLPDGMNIYFNQQWVEYTGLTLEESYGEGWIKPFHPEDQEHAWNAWQNAVINNAGYSLECRLRQKDGAYFWWLVRAVPIFDKKGNIIKWFGTCTDIQNIKETEIELLKAKEKAEESDLLKSAFLANMSHEIRTPMNGILGFAELLKEPGLTGEMQQVYISIIEESGARMLNVINDIVDISKIEAGLMEVNILESNINKQIEFIHTFFNPQIKEKGLHFLIKKTLSEKEAFIKSDSEKIYSILTNLVKNAIKFTDEGTIELGYTLKTENGSAELEFYVKDMGIGIPKNRQVAIFERFIQADISDKMARQGTGLGLSISKAYVEILGGKIWVESEEGKGSIFYFTLPYQTEPVEKIVPDRDNWSEKLTYEASTSLSSLKILVAEDDKISRMLISKIVKGNSKVLLEASNGIEAVAICRNNPDIDLILMDIQMPELNGYVATQQIRQFNKDVIIIAQSAFGLADDREKSIVAGCTDYISKPINKIELLTLIQKYFNK